MYLLCAWYPPHFIPAAIPWRWCWGGRKLGTLHSPLVHTLHAVWHYCLPHPRYTGQTWLSPAHREARPTYAMNCHHFMPHVAIRVRECPGACGNDLFVRPHLALCQHLLRVKPWLWQGRAEYCWPSLRNMLWVLPGMWVASEAFLTSGVQEWKA